MAAREKGAKNNYSSVAKREKSRRRQLVRLGKAAWLCPRYPVEVACQNAGLV